MVSHDHYIIISFVLLSSRYAVLPFAVKAVSQDHEHDDLLRLMLPGLCHVTAEDAGRRVLLNAKGHAAIISQLLTTWLPAAMQDASQHTQEQDPEIKNRYKIAPEDAGSGDQASQSNIMNQSSLQATS